MGGTAFEIPVEVDPEVFKKATLPRRSFWGALLGLRVAPPTGGPCDDMEIRIPELRQSIRQTLKSFIDQAIPDPWPATRSFLKTYSDFLKPAFTIHGSRDDSGKPRRWAVNLRFSGCAGVAEVSALLAVHWAEIWYQRDRSRIEGALHEAGLTPSGMPESWWNEPRRALFLPAGCLGYAECTPADENEGSESGNQSFHFELDEAAAEAYAEKALAVVQVFEEQFAGVVGDGRCRCQLCMPDFDFAGLDELTD